MDKISLQIDCTQQPDGTWLLHAVLDGGGKLRETFDKPANTQAEAEAEAVKMVEFCKGYAAASPHITKITIHEGDEAR